MRRFLVGRSTGRIVTIVAVLVAAVAGVAWAHATLVRSDPPKDARLSAAPRMLRLEFSESVRPATSRVELVAPDSQRTALALRADTADLKALLADVPPQAIAGRYRVEWRLVGPDGHAVTGQYGFTIDSIPIAPAVDSAEAIAGPQEDHEPVADSPIQQAIRFFSSLAMVLVMGSVAFALFVLPRVGDGSPHFRESIGGSLRRVCAIGAWSLLILAVVRLANHGLVLAGSLDALRLADVTGVVTDSNFGRGWLLQVAASSALLLGLLRKQPAGWSVMAAISVPLALSASLLGHPVAVPDLALVAVSLDAVHVLAAGGWAGAILVMSIAALPRVLAVPPATRTNAVRGLLQAFSPLALFSAATLVVTGVAGAWLQLRDVSLILGSPYGLVLFRKVVIVAVIAIVGAYHWRVVQPSLDGDRAAARLRWSIGIDVALVLLLLVLTAVLTGTAPPVR